MARGPHAVLLGVLVGATVLSAAPARAAAPAPVPKAVKAVLDATPPPAVVKLTAGPSDQRVVLNWAYPTMPADWVEVIIRRYSGATITPTGPEGLTIHAGRGTSFVDAAGLTNGTPVSYAIFVRDTAGNFSPAATAVDVVPNIPVVTSLTASSSKVRIGYGEATLLHAELLRADDGRPVIGENLTFYARAVGNAKWGVVGTVKTAADGTANIKFTPRANSDFQVKHDANPLFTASVSNLSRTDVSPALTAKLASVYLGTDEPIFVVGALHPAHPGATIYLQRKAAAGPWRSVASTKLAVDGSYRLTVLNATTGEFDYRVHKPADSDHLSATSAPAHVTVSPRTLRSGMSGRDVLALQQQLARLKYDVGAQNGKFGYDTLHALVPFQKVNGLPRTGIVDAATRARLARPVQALLREKRSGNQIEIDLTKQVLIAGTNGVVTRVLDISSGGGYIYEDQGKPYKADTPIGHYSIQRKINGIRVSRLGELYRPAYFFGGYAIHGSPSVPIYPASHGCIRVTNPSQDRQYDLLTIGTSVFLFT